MTPPKRTIANDKVFSIACSSRLAQQADWAAGRRGLKRGEWIRFAMIEGVKAEIKLASLERGQIAGEVV
jgi:hypothetical protein